MFWQILLSVGLCFSLLCGLLIFFIRFKERVPYYIIEHQKCICLLDLAVKGRLPEHDWHIFIGMGVRTDEQVEALREKCAEIDEAFCRGTKLFEGRPCVAFSEKGIKQLTALLDEWRHKANYQA
ncbi:hypothetical protein GV054_03405 [Marinomonas mediterranea]|uniref:hypothetical protein n=1 Tax=Marinomonas mediterranea TaxID=119864 RepID=UPI00234B0DF3|nr:hypothetical protein [Marinomonas mediterranea]WCN12123.1 hypothetical protein GV054_03405 [Marinomonas mediterranea]